MEVACSFDEIAQALAEDDYIHADSYFNVSDAPDLPSMLRVFDSKSGLDSPESFPESPCSDEDIARVLEITQMSSPSLLESCIPDNFVGLPTPQNDVLDPNNINVMKTRDPCITNAVLHDVFSNTSSTNFSGRSAGPLDGFCLSSSLFSHSVSVNLNHIIHSKENDAINTSCFELATPALSPLSESDHIQQPPNLSDQTNQFTEQFIDFNLESGSGQQPLETIPDSMKVHSTFQDAKIVEQQSTSSSQKRKRKRKSFSKSPKSRKANKRKNADSSPKPQPKPKKAKLSNQNTSESKPNTPLNKRKPNHKTSTSTLSIPQEEAAQMPTQPPTNFTSETSCQKEEPTLRRSSRSTRNTENYNFRLSSLVKRVETERRQKEPKQPKGKAKPPPLSKYRRRTANARERDRMKEINDAFDDLKSSLPVVEDESKQKTTKFTILKLALNYISALREMLGYEDLSPSDEGMDIAMSLSPDDSTSSSHDEQDLITENTARSPSSESNQLSVSSPQNAGSSQFSISSSLAQQTTAIADGVNSLNANGLIL